MGKQYARFHTRCLVDWLTENDPAGALRRERSGRHYRWCDECGAPTVRPTESTGKIYCRECARVYSDRAVRKLRKAIADLEA